MMVVGCTKAKKRGARPQEGIIRDALFAIPNYLTVSYLFLFLKTIIITNYSIARCVLRLPTPQQGLNRPSILSCFVAPLWAPFTGACRVGLGAG